MRCFFNHNGPGGVFQTGFSLVEVVAALAVLALISSSVVVVMNRNAEAATDITMQYHAFEVARENMETLLAMDSVVEKSEYGISDRYPQVDWQTVVEAFYEPVTNRMWVKAVCTASYDDSDGQARTVELEHWLTSVTRGQMIQILQQRQLADQQSLDDPARKVPSAENASEFDPSLEDSEMTGRDALKNFDPNTMDISELMRIIEDIFSSSR